MPNIRERRTLLNTRFHEFANPLMPVHKKITDNIALAK